MSAVLEDEVMEEARLGRLESDVAHIRSDISELKADGRQIKVGLNSVMNSVIKDEYPSLLQEIIRTEISLKIWMVCIAAVEVVVMAHGFKWL